MKVDLVTQREIIKSVAEKLGMSNEKIEHVYKFFVHRIVELSKDHTTNAIFLPGLGYMYSRAPIFKYRAEFLRKYVDEEPTKQKMIDTYDAKRKAIEKLVNSGELHPLNNHYRKYRLSSRYLRGKYKDHELEKLQNDIYEQEYKKS